METTLGLKNSYLSHQKLGGVYAIVCSKTWRSYVGSSVDLKEREQEHFRLLSKMKHDNQELQEDFNLYGKDKFYFEILENVENHNQLLEKESYWQSIGYNLYNKTLSRKMFNLTDEEKERFWKWINIKDNKDCWNWFGAKDKDGYGRIGFRRNKKKIMFRANRLAYFLSKDNWNDFSVVCHKCDNPSCCNPNHLFLGSFSANAKDKVSKNRGRNKLTQEIVNKIRNNYIDNIYKSSKQIKEWLLLEYKINVSFNCINVLLRNNSFYDEKYSILSRKDYRKSNLKQFKK